MRATVIVQHIHRLLLLAVIGMFGIVTAIGITKLMTPGDQGNYDALLLTPRPKSLEELVGNSSIVVIGTVGSFIGENWFAGYDEQGRLIKAKDKNLPPEAEIPFYDYNLQVEEILKSDIPIETGQSVTLRMFVNGTKQDDRPGVEFPPSIPGDRYLFFLYRNPDNATYGLRYATASRLVIDGPIVTYSDGDRTPVNFNGRKTPPEFIQEVKRLIQ
jgi:hypothetical protein